MNTARRSKCRWFNEGEKNTEYFLNLEKHHCKQSVITRIKTDGEISVTTYKDILNLCKSFYKNLYSSQVETQVSYTDDFWGHVRNENPLSEDEIISCEGELSKGECLQALKAMECNKSPGSDGRPLDFYKNFWNDLSDPFLNSMNSAFKSGQLSISQQRGIIRLIPKKDADPSSIKNWRPISLLNCDYKIAAKAIANRLKKILPKIIDNDQTGFLKGRFIGENVTLIIDSVINFAAAKKIPGLLLFLDFEKAFDTVEWDLYKKLFNFTISGLL